MITGITLFRLEIILEGLVVVFAVAQSSVDETHQRDVATKTKCFIRSAEDVLMEDVFDAILFEPQTRDELIVATQGSLEVELHASHHCVDTFSVHFGKRKATLLQKQMTRVLCVVEVVGIIDNALDVAFVVAHLHSGFKNVFIHLSFRYDVITG